MAQLLAGDHEARSFPVTRGDILYSTEEPPHTLFVLIDGLVGVSRLTYDGKRLVTEVLKAGDIFGDLTMSGAAAEGESAHAISNCRVFELEAGETRHLIATEPRLALAFLRAADRRRRAVSDRIEEFAFDEVNVRVAAAVLRCATTADRTAYVTHQDVADMAGTYRETATRVLGELKALGLLTLERGAVTVPDSAALAAFASPPLSLAAG